MTGADFPEDEAAWDSSRVVNEPSELAMRSERPTMPEIESPIRFALAVPHTPWRPERVKSLETLFAMLGNRPQFFRLFDDKEPNWEWSRKLWRWGVEMAAQGATHLVQLQDDIRPMPHFWSVLRAMVEANPDRVLGLHVNHPIARNLAHMGRRWFRTRAWLVGPAYVWPLKGPDRLGLAVDWIADQEAAGALSKHEVEHEDVTLSTFLARTARDVWHPIPALQDVDLTIGSTYENVEGHIDDHRRPTVLWHGFRVAELQTVDYWRPPPNVEVVPAAGTGVCTFCGKSEGAARSAATGAALCKPCGILIMGTWLGLKMGATP